MASLTAIKRAIDKLADRLQPTSKSTTRVLICSAGYMHFVDGEFVGIHKPKQKGQSWKQKMILAGNAIPKSTYPYGKLRCLRAGHKRAQANKIFTGIMAKFNEESRL